VSDAKKENESLAAETFALQLLLISLCHRIGETSPDLRTPILQAFDDAANNAERFSIAAGRNAAHLPESLRIVEQLRAALMGPSRPKSAV